MKRSKILGLLLMFFISHHLCGQALGEVSYPTKSIDMIVAYGPGGGSDIIARFLSAYFAKVSGVQLNVINKSGGAGAIGLQAALTAKPDGYTMLMDTHGIGSMIALYPGTYPVDWRKRTWCARIAIEPMVYQVRIDSPWKTLKEVAEFIKKNPEKVRWGTSGLTGCGSPAGLQFFRANDIPANMVRRVMFQGAAEVVVALAGGHIDFAIQQYGDSAGLIEGKKTRPIAVVAAKRLPLLPDVPTMTEAGYPMLDVIGWQAVSGPAGLPRHVVDFWAKSLEKACKDPAFIEKAEKLKKEVNYLGPKEFESFVEGEYQKYLKLGKEW
jgi:tripartite-type tricarboxylate transporter receptor subunit TctC